MKDYYCVMTFHSTYSALQFEKIFKDKDIKVKLMPVPRQVSSSCGTAAEFPCEKRDEILKICKELDIEINEAERIEKEKENNWFNKLMKSKK